VVRSVGWTIGVVPAAVGVAFGQSATPAAFVANNGNLEGSVTSFRVRTEGATPGGLEFVQKLVLGQMTSGGPSDPGVNAYSISIRPDGSLLAISHATASTTLEQVSIVRVHSDATLSLVAELTTPDSPLDLAWLRNDVLAITRTRTSGVNQVIAYRYDESTPGSPALVEIDREETGAFTSKLVVSQDGRLLFANDSPLSGGGLIRAYLIGDDGRLTFASVGSTPGAYAIGQGVTPDGRFLYSCSGSASGGSRVFGFGVSSSGVLEPLETSPYFVGGVSPKQAVVSPDGRFVYVGHGSDGTIRVMPMDVSTGSLIDGGQVEDVGIQSSLGDIATMRVRGSGGAIDLLLYTDKETFDGTGRGLFSSRIEDDGTLRPITVRLDTQGISPNDIAVWTPSEGRCVADVDDGTGTGTPDGGITIDDLLFYVAIYADGDTRADVDNGSGTGQPDGGVTIDDLLYYLVRYDTGC
jgi:WD40 repeat protein